MGEYTAVMEKSFLSGENAQNRPEIIQWKLALDVSILLRKKPRERRCQQYPVCLNISRENGRSFLIRAAGRNTTSFAGNVKGTASRASVPFLFDARITYQRGDKRDGIRVPQSSL